MQIIPRIVLRPQDAHILLIPHRGIEIHHRIKHPAIPYPHIHPLPRPLALGARVWLRADIEPGRAERRDGRPENRQPRAVRAQRELGVRGDERVADGALRGRAVRRRADVVDALEDDGVPDARLGQDVAVEARQRVRPQAVGEHAVAAGGLVADGEGGKERVVGALQAREQRVRPPVVAVGRAAPPVGDAVADEGERAAAGGWRPRVQRADEVPVRDAGGGGGAAEVGRRGVVAEGEPGCRARPWVRGYRAAGLAGGEVDRDAEVAAGGYGQVDGVGDDECAAGDRVVGGAAEGEGLERGGVDEGGAGAGVVGGCGDGLGEGFGLDNEMLASASRSSLSLFVWGEATYNCHGRDGQRRQAEGVGEPEADARGARRDVDGLPDGGVLEDETAAHVEGRWRQVGGLGQLGHGCPCYYPMSCRVVAGCSLPTADFLVEIGLVCRRCAGGMVREESEQEED